MLIRVLLSRTFQFLDGAIKRRKRERFSILQYGFNSLMVRLKARIAANKAGLDFTFQFLDGAIKSSTTIASVITAIVVSIP